MGVMVDPCSGQWSPSSCGLDLMTPAVTWGYPQTVTPDAWGTPVPRWQALRTLTHLLSSSYLDLEQKKRGDSC